MSTKILISSKLIYEIIYANENINNKDSIKLYVQLFNKTCKDILKHKTRGAKNSYKIFRHIVDRKHTYKFINKLPFYFYKLKNYKKDKIFQSEVRYFTMYIRNLPKIIALKVSIGTIKFLFIKSKEERMKILKDILYWGTFGIIAKIAGGGRDLDFEGGLPDTDLKFGIGMHRNFLFHSILIVLGAEFVIRFFFNFYKIFYEELPEEHFNVWDSINTFIQLVEESSISAIYMGVGIHFIVDSNILNGLHKSIKPIVGLPPMSMEMHKMFLLANSITSIAASTSILDPAVSKTT